MSTTYQARKNVLVTGVTSGVGHSVAKQLRQRGCFVIATCRNEQQAQELMTSQVCDMTVRVDLGDIPLVQTLPEQLRAAGIDDLAGFIHCAAVTGAGPIETIGMEEARRIFEVNVFGLLALIQASTEFLRKGKGRMVLTGSVAGFSVWPMLGIYGATKHAMEALADAARRELWPWGIQVSLIRPGGIKTRMVKLHLEEMNAKIAALQGREKEHYLALYQSYIKTIGDGGNTSATPEYVAEKIVKVFESPKPKAVYCVGTDCKVLRFIDLLFPDSTVDFLAKKLFRVSPPTRA